MQSFIHHDLAIRFACKRILLKEQEIDCVRLNKGASATYSNNTCDPGWGIVECVVLVLAYGLRTVGVNICCGPSDRRIRHRFWGLLQCILFSAHLDRGGNTRRKIARLVPHVHVRRVGYDVLWQYECYQTTSKAYFSKKSTFGCYQFAFREWLTHKRSHWKNATPVQNECITSPVLVSI